MRLFRPLLGVVALLAPTLLVAQNAPMTPNSSRGLMAPSATFAGPMTPANAGSGAGPGGCSNSLDFSQACNSQYLGAILLKTLSRALAVAASLGLASSSAFATVVAITAGSGTNLYYFDDGSGNHFPAAGIYGVAGDYQADVNSGHRLMTTTAVNVTEHDCSGSISVADTAVTLISASATIHGYRIANIDSGHGDEVAWFSTTTTAAASTAQSFPLPPPTPTTFAGFGSYTSPPGEGVNSNLSVVAHTSGHIISCTYW